MSLMVRRALNLPSSILLATLRKVSRSTPPSANLSYRNSMSLFRVLLSQTRSNKIFEEFSASTIPTRLWLLNSFSV